MQRAAVLMYHRVGAPVAHPRGRFLNVSAASFSRQVAALGRLGYRSLTLAEVSAAMASGASLPRRTVCFTFDDGYTCVRDHALPVLDRAGHVATVYVPTAWVGDANRWDAESGTPVLPMMDWADLRRLQDAGWEIGGHTRTHAHLHQLGDAELEAEVRGGCDETLGALGPAQRTFCYPFGHLDDRTPAVVRSAGYVAACTTASGIARAGGDPYRMPRVKVAYRDGVAGLLYRMLVRPRLGSR